MSAAIGVRSDIASVDLRRFARRCSDADQVRRVLAVALILDGGSRSDAARMAGVTLQIVRDWVLRFNAAGADGLLASGNTELLGKQLIATVVTYVIAGAGTFIIVKLLSLVMELRVKPEAEYQGLDINEHGEEGYGEEFAAGLSLAEKEG